MYQTNCVKDVIDFNSSLMQFEGAYELINDWKKKSKHSKPTTAMYNMILGGYFREVA